MKTMIRFVLFLGGLSLTACHSDPVSLIPEYEKAFEADNTPGKADTLVLLYQAAVKAHPERHADNLHYLSRAAQLKFTYKKDAVTAVRLLNAALKEHGVGQNLTEPIGMLTPAGHAYLYKGAADLTHEPDDIDEMHANLMKNTMWIDSSLARLDKEMGSPTATDKAKAEDFIHIAETYAALIEQKDPDKSVDLLLKAAGLAKSVGNPNKALQMYYNVGEKKPDHAKAPQALFMMAFIYENDLHDLDKAKSTYEEFLKRYPKDPDYADDAQNALKYLGKSPEDIVKEFEKNPQ